MDLKEFETKRLSNEGVEIELKSLKTGKGTGAFIKVHGMDSDAFDAAKLESARELTEFVEAGNTVTPEFRSGMTSRMLAACTISWRGIDVNGSEFPFTPANAVHLYTEYPSIREQINLAIGDRGNFVSA